MRKLDIYEIAMNMGTSVYYLEQTYIHTTTMMKKDELTKGQGIYKHLEEQQEKRDAAESAIKDVVDTKRTETDTRHTKKQEHWIA